MIKSDIVALARKRASELLSDSGRRWAHVRRVGERADGLPAGLPWREEVIAAAWLHDIGYAAVSSGFHPLDGARWAASEGFPDLVVRLIAYHTGAYEEAEERGLSSDLGVMAHPPQEALDVVTFIDMTTSPDGDPVEPTERVSEILARYSAEDVVHRAVTRSGRSLIASAERGRELVSRSLS